MTTDIPFRGWRVTTKVFNEIYEPLSSYRLGSMAQPRGWLQGFSVQGEAKKMPGRPAGPLHAAWRGALAKGLRLAVSG